ncbi:pfkB family carbohydrate kinase [Micromonas pusilla CCMP1545]|uniref:PfkB family carbohydrate kinase n=1 Tax=Micromonas pusilla (strain CCMP1545) TaxID=564608 RepID=C1MJS1_MICPC|nr:pfkB family carbohydrate kinase [Micromonas pusilla CCMP1545]EEH59245.1 pfkB family carbohydrate kinase [Micromonas pusilla CCMP1545]|eukprot:XP_003055869.1 pfkB family carbohydrate kinase [Micromonas pusilla CCMP1545]
MFASRASSPSPSPPPSLARASPRARRARAAPATSRRATVVLRSAASSSSASSASAASPREKKIVGVGSAGVDYLASIASFPKPDAKLRTDAFETQGGGNAGNALVAMARLGAEARSLAFNPRPRRLSTPPLTPLNLTPARAKASILTKLSDDGAGVAILDEFRREGVGCESVVVEPGKSSPFTYIIVDREGSTRTCIHTPGPEFRAEEMPDDAVEARPISHWSPYDRVGARLIEGADLVYFDGRLTEVAIRVARAANAAGVPVLVEGERPRDGLETLLTHGDYVCTSTEYPKAHAAAASGDGEENLELETAMVKTLASLPRARALVTTLGARGSVMIRRVDDWGGGAGEKEREGDAPKTTTLKELLAALESGASEDPIARRSSSRMTRVLSFRARARNLTSRHAGNSIPFHSIPSTDIAPADDAAAAVGPCDVTFAPACLVTKSAVVDTTGAGDSFIGSMCYGIANGFDLTRAMRLGSYVAARKCREVSETGPRATPFARRAPFLEDNFSSTFFSSLDHRPHDLGARPGLPRAETIPAELIADEDELAAMPEFDDDAEARGVGAGDA